MSMRVGTGDIHQVQYEPRQQDKGDFQRTQWGSGNYEKHYRDFSDEQLGKLKDDDRQYRRFNEDLNRLDVEEFRRQMEQQNPDRPDDAAPPDGGQDRGYDVVPDNNGGRLRRRYRF